MNPIWPQPCLTRITPQVSIQYPPASFNTWSRTRIPDYQRQSIQRCDAAHTRSRLGWNDANQSIVVIARFGALVSIAGQKIK